jgi:hypothetical protein
MGARLKVVVVLAVTAALALFGVEVMLAQDTDGITVHCVPPNVVNLVACLAPGADLHPLGIQDAVDHAESGEIVLVGVGMFDEQVKIERPLTLEGEGMGVTTIKPVGPVMANTRTLFSGFPVAPIVLVDSTEGVSISALTVDGDTGQFNACSPGYVGIYYRGSSGAIDDTHVTKIRHAVTSGCQFVLGIFVDSGKDPSGPGPRLKANVAITDSMLDQYGKNGITANEAGTFVAVNANTVTGKGPAVDIAQNGVQIGFGARGFVSDNTISAHNYLPPDVVACGVLFFRAGGGLGRARNNTFVANEQNICNTGGGPSPNSAVQQ